VDCPTSSSFVGICPGDWPDAEACGATLYGRAKAKQHTCTECGRLWNVDELRPYFVTRAREWLATATEISRALPALGELRATPERIRKWKQRGRLQVRGHVVVGKNAAGEDIEQPTYRVGDVEDLLSQDAATQARVRSEEGGQLMPPESEAACRRRFRRTTVQSVTRIGERSRPLKPGSQTAAGLRRVRRLTDGRHGLPHRLGPGHGHRCLGLRPDRLGRARADRQGRG
jgi:hypothetical protein